MKYFFTMLSMVMFLLIATLQSKSQDLTKVNVDSSDTTFVSIKHLEEFTVYGTRNRTELNLLEVPSSVSVYSSSDIDKNKVESLRSFSTMTPNFFMPDFGSKLTAPIFIRGIGSRINSPAVGLYVDDIPYFDKASFDFDMFGVRQVEVFKGPQGTLYGKNAMAGVIYIQTLNPTADPKTRFSLDYGNYQALHARISHSEMLTNKFGYAFSASYIDDEGYFTNKTTGEGVGQTNSGSARLKLRYEDAGNLMVQLVGHVEKSSEIGYPYSLVTDSTDAYDNVVYNEPSTYDRDSYDLGLVVKKELGNSTIKSATSYQFFDDKQSLDQDFLPESKYYVDQTVEQHMFSEELSISTDVSDNIESVSGVFGFYQSLDKLVDVYYYPGYYPYNPGFDGNIIKAYDYQNFGFAAFHQSKLSFGNSFITLGLRADYENNQMVYDYDRFSDGTKTPADSLDLMMDFFAFMPKIAFRQRLNENQSVYAQISRGYRSGGFNSTIEEPGDESFDPDYTWNYELGHKATWLQGRVNTEVSLFYIDWLNQQVYQTVASGFGKKVENAGRTRSFGAEFALAVNPFQGFTFSTNWGYTNATFIDYKDDVKDLDYDGNNIPYVPEFNGIVSGDYVKSLKNKVFTNYALHIDWAMVGNIYWYDDNSEFQETYHTLNASVSAKMFDRIDISLWGRNLNGAEYHTYQFQTSGNTYAQSGRPLTYGVRLNFDFNN